MPSASCQRGPAAGLAGDRVALEQQARGDAGHARRGRPAAHHSSRISRTRASPRPSGPQGGRDGRRTPAPPTRSGRELRRPRTGQRLGVAADSASRRGPWRGWRPTLRRLRGCRRGWTPRRRKGKVTLTVGLAGSGQGATACGPGAAGRAAPGPVRSAARARAGGVGPGNAHSRLEVPPRLGQPTGPVGGDSPDVVTLHPQDLVIIPLSARPQPPAETAGRLQSPRVSAPKASDQSSGGSGSLPSWPASCRARVCTGYPLGRVALQGQQRRGQRGEQPQLKPGGVGPGGSSPDNASARSSARTASAWACSHWSASAARSCQRTASAVAPAFS